MPRTFKQDDEFIKTLIKRFIDSKKWGEEFFFDEILVYVIYVYNNQRKIPNPYTKPKEYCSFVRSIQELIREYVWSDIDKGYVGMGGVGVVKYAR